MYETRSVKSEGIDIKLTVKVNGTNTTNGASFS